ncbi:MAG: NTP transferase domain-containing protein [Actinomycetia bacterium]|nr:NTP transferase domain-containing protein [Actinomycetes bacterium]
MGRPKPALPYGSTTMVGAVVASADEAELSPVIVVTGFHEGPVAAAVGGSAHIANNLNPERGNVSSLLVGLDALDDPVGVVLLLADMPEVRVDVISSLLDGMSASAFKAGWVEYRDGRGHPIALSVSSFDDVRALRGSKALWPFLSSLSEEDTFVVRVDEPTPTDVNTPQDYERLRRRAVS